MRHARPLLAPLATALLLAACGESDGGGTAPRGYDAAPPADAAAATDAPQPPGSDAAPPSPADAATDAPAKPTRTLVYVGAADSKIHVYALDRATLDLTPLATYPTGNFPSFLAFDLARNHVYATNENDGAVAAFDLDPRSGALTSKGVRSAGAGTTHVSVDATGTRLFAANYGGATASVFPIQADGSLAAATQTLSPGTNPHCFVASPANDYAFVVAKGSDQIAEYALSGGTLTPNATTPLVHTPAGSGPRHIAFHPSGAYAYVIDENDSTMRAFSYDAGHGTLTEMQALSTLPPGFNGTNTGAEVQVARSGRFVFGSNRGDDSIATFSVDAQTGKLAYVTRTPSGGKTPRHFSLDEDDGVLFAANQDSGNVVAFRLDAQTAALTSPKTTTIGAAPYFALAIVLTSP